MSDRGTASARSNRDGAPMFSFLMTAYRTEDVIGRAIESVIAQSSDDWELVVVDNGNVDAMVAVVEPYLADPRIRLLRQENRGAAGGTMAAAAEARGDFLVPLNSDDAVQPGFCARMAAAATEAPGASAFTCDAFRFTDPGEQRMTRTYLDSAGLEGPADPERPLRLIDVIDGPCPYYTAAIRREVWDALGGLHSETPLVDDLDFWLRALGEGHDVRTVPDVLGSFRIQAGSVSRPDDNDRAEEFERQREAALVRAVERSDDAECRVALERVLRRQRYQRAIRWARWHFQRGETTDARRHAEIAYALRRTVRSTVLVAALRVAPGALRAVHPTKRWVQARLAETNRSRWLRRGHRPGRPQRPTPAGAEFLALTNRPVTSRQSGYDLRVANLCAHLPGTVHLAVAPFQPEDESRPGLALDGVFASVEELASLRTEQPRLTRHLRLSNRRFLSRSRPEAFAAARSRLRAIVRERGITHVVVFGGGIAELAVDLPDVTVVLDVCDSATLTAARAPAPRGSGVRGVLRRASRALDVARKRRTENRYPADVELVTTIGEADARAVEGRRPARRVRVVPNGVDEAYVRPLPPAGDRRGVVFWGNLAFGPNRDALRSFVHDVHLPRLRHEGVELCVVGADAPSWLTDLAADEPGIVLTGYVDDLAATVGRYPIMINPMRSGSGMKNKVLEAFGLGLAVVSTPLGVEAIPGAEGGRHVALATSDDEIADTVLALLGDDTRRERLRRAAHELVHERYRWAVIGEAWRALFPPERYPDESSVPHPRDVTSPRAATRPS